MGAFTVYDTHTSYTLYERLECYKIFALYTREVKLTLEVEMIHVFFNLRCIILSFLKHACHFYYSVDMRRECDSRERLGDDCYSQRAETL